MEMPIPRKLALAVIEHALQDLVRPLACKSESRQAASRDAREFIFSEERREDLKCWLDMAGLRYDPFVKRAKEILDQKIDIALLKEQMTHAQDFNKVTDEDAVH